MTVGQYCQFLNAVAETDTYGLYNSNMAMASGLCDHRHCPERQLGQLQLLGRGRLQPGRQLPDLRCLLGRCGAVLQLAAKRPAYGAEGRGTTETGAYTLSGDTTDLMTIPAIPGRPTSFPRRTNGTRRRTTRAASDTAGYWTYPTRSNTAPSNTLVRDRHEQRQLLRFAGTGTGGYTDPANYLTPVGAFAGSPGPYGTYDMGGDVWQWNETAVNSSSRGLRGGSWADISNSSLLASSLCNDCPPATEFDYVGFRVASVPEPGSVMLLLALAAGLLGYAWRQQADKLAS